MTFQQLKNLEFLIKKEWPKEVHLSQMTLGDFDLILRTMLLILERTGRLK